MKCQECNNEVHDPKKKYCSRACSLKGVKRFQIPKAPKYGRYYY